MKNYTRTIIIVLAVNVLLFAAIAVVGCQAPMDNRLAPLFDQFNAAVQAGLADCKADPNACLPTLELVAAEVDKWNQVIGVADPNS